jgi:hypothetical protein
MLVAAGPVEWQHVGAHAQVVQYYDPAALDKSPARRAAVAEAMREDSLETQRVGADFGREAQEAEAAGGFSAPDGAD